MLCLDDYFMVEVDKQEVDPDTGKKVKKKVILFMSINIIVIVGDHHSVKVNTYKCISIYNSIASMITFVRSQKKKRHSAV